MQVEREKQTVLKHNAKQEIRKQKIEVQEKERQRFSEEIHDNLMSDLHLIRLLNNKKSDQDIIDKKLQGLGKKVRTLSHQLHPPQLEHCNLYELISDHIQALRSSYEIELDCVQYHGETLSNEIKLHVFRTIQELIQNIMKHAQADAIFITIRKTYLHLSLVVEDNGKGFHSSPSKGIGLQNIENRIAAIKGGYKLVSKPEKGTKFIFHLNHYNSYEKRKNKTKHIG